MLNKPDKPVDGEAQRCQRPLTMNTAYASYRSLAEALGQMIGRCLHRSEQKQTRLGDRFN